MKYKYGLAFLLIWLPVLLSIRMPPNACPDIFQYYKDPQGRIYGEVKLPYDNATVLKLGVNASFAKAYITEIPKLKLKIGGKDLIAGTSHIKFIILFPLTKVVPKISGITYNDIVYCNGSQESVTLEGVTNTWTQSIFQFKPTENGSDIQNTDITDDPSLLKSTVTPVSPQIPPQQPDPLVTPTQDIPNKPSTISNLTKRDTDPLKYKEIEGLFFNPATCGEATGDGIRIYGATDTKLGQYPWLVAVFWKRGFNLDYKCSATLISRKHVLTAARCFEYNNGQVVNIEEIFLVMGTDNLDEWESNGAVTRTARRVDVHPNYNKNKESADGDIAIILLDRLVQFTDVLSPVCLWKGDSNLQPLIKKMGVIVGFGEDENSPQGLTHVLKAKRAEMHIVTQNKCLNRPLGLKLLLSEKTFCTKSGEKQLTGLCKGDTGAGFLISMDGAYYLRGIASVIPYKDGKCDLSTGYVAFCDAAKFKDWIECQMNDNCY
ncbi:CLIP domain-containing serine protease B4-like [Diabrotica undecimpunctata]|uniref:CLIP domain-containing serine protease B4-like n=1 Tax=Diabrotica undecimpunctata TaxID=50387 RepID=UPI003B63F796